ncbi:unnamed protein product [Closterium sp. Naga37s-1]|nr:unnamed protein product [Closterium sp. Naga37s-1]
MAGCGRVRLGWPVKEHGQLHVHVLPLLLRFCSCAVACMWLRARAAGPERNENGRAGCTAAAALRAAAAAATCVVASTARVHAVARALAATAAVHTACSPPYVLLAARAAMRVAAACARHGTAQDVTKRGRQRAAAYGRAGACKSSCARVCLGQGALRGVMGHATDGARYEWG